MAVPIGNIGDITRRAVETLAAADAVAAEDTRMTGKLLSLLGVNRPMLSYHEHNAERMRPVLLDRIAAGEAIALVSDAGTPLVSDPGFKLVRAARERGLYVTALPGPSAVLTALTLSGLPTDRFLFAGFPPVRRTARRRFLEELAPVAATLVLFETAPRLAASLGDMAAVLGDAREAAVARELTKLFEEVRRGPLGELARHYRAAGPPKGEIVVVVGPPEPAAAADFDLDGALAAALAQHSLREAVAAVTAASGLKRGQVYARALALKGERDGDAQP